MNLDMIAPIVLVSAIALAVITFTICSTIETLAKQRQEHEEKKTALQNGYEQKFEMETTQSSNWAWVKRKEP